MEHPGVIATNYEAIKARADEIGVPLKWALDQRRQYLENRIEEQEAIAAQRVKELAGSSELEHRLAMDRIERVEKAIRKAQFDLSRLKSQHRAKRNGVSDEEIERAREYPIAQLLPNSVRRGMTLCCFHEDRHPSMSVKNNRAHCFSCNKTWDAIALVMELNGLEFIEAVRRLNA